MWCRILTMTSNSGPGDGGFSGGYLAEFHRGTTKDSGPQDANVQFVIRYSVISHDWLRGEVVSSCPMHGRVETNLTALCDAADVNAALMRRIAPKSRCARKVHKKKKNAPPLAQPITHRHSPSTRSLQIRTDSAPP